MTHGTLQHLSGSAMDTSAYGHGPCERGMANMMWTPWPHHTVRARNNVIGGLQQEKAKQRAWRNRGIKLMERLARLLP